MNLDPPYGHAKSEQLSQVTHGVDPYDLWQLCPRRARMLEKRGFDIGGPQEPINSIDCAFLLASDQTLPSSV